MATDEQPNAAPVSLILSRRSTARLTDVPPTADQLETILQAAVTVPDHGMLTPYRFAVVSGSGRATFGDALAAAALEADPTLPEAVVEKVRQKAFAGPMQLVLIASPKQSDKVPQWEQVASASCTGYAVALAAHALGLGAIWKTMPFPAGAALRQILSMEAEEFLLGWVNVGVPVRPVGPRSPVDVSERVVVLDGPTPRPYSSQG